MVGLLAPGAHRLAEADIERHQAAADMRIGAVEHPRAALVALKPSARKLRIIRPLCDVPSTIARLSRAIDRIGRAGIVLRGIAQEGAEIARRREAEAADRRVLGAIDQLVEAARLEAGRSSRDASRPAPAACPASQTPKLHSAVRDRHARVLLAGAHGQASAGSRRRKRRLVVQARGGIAVVAAERIVLDLLAQADRQARRPAPA